MLAQKWERRRWAETWKMHPSRKTAPLNWKAFTAQHTNISSRQKSVHNSTHPDLFTSSCTLVRYAMVSSCFKLSSRRTFTMPCTTHKTEAITPPVLTHEHPTLLNCSVPSTNTEYSSYKILPLHLFTSVSSALFSSSIWSWVHFACLQKSYTVQPHG